MEKSDFSFLSIKAYSAGKVKSTHTSAFALLGAGTNLRELFCRTLSSSPQEAYENSQGLLWGAANAMNFYQQ